MKKNIKLYSKPLIEAELLYQAPPADRPRLLCGSMDFHNRDATLKLNPVNLMQFVDDLCIYFNENVHKIDQVRFENSPFVRAIHDASLEGKSSFPKHYIFPGTMMVDLHKHYFCAETIRDIYSGDIDNLLKDNKSSTTDNVVSFGYLATATAGVETKPQRIKYIEMCNESPNFDYISTEKFNRFSTHTKKFSKVLDLKAKYKYFIDLKGHTYSTKSYLFMASKRVFFSSKHPEQLTWETDYLKPWKNFIPVRPDLSNLNEHYEIIESDPALYKEIISNNIKLLENELSKKSMLLKLVSKILLNLELK